jgi:hypothetical protein
MAEYWNAFPQAGLVRKYRPLILRVVKDFHAKYPSVPFQDLLVEAVRLATTAEGRYRPELKTSFASFALPHLKGLHRFAKQYHNELDARWEKLKRQLEAAEKTASATEQLDYSGGDNGARITFDKNVRLPNGKRRRITTARQIHTRDYSECVAFTDAISANFSSLAELTCAREALAAMHDAYQCRLREERDIRPGQTDVRITEGRKPPIVIEQIDAMIDPDVYAAVLADTKPTPRRPGRTMSAAETKRMEQWGEEMRAFLGGPGVLIDAFDRYHFGNDRRTYAALFNKLEKFKGKMSRREKYLLKKLKAHLKSS